MEVRTKRCKRKHDAFECHGHLARVQDEDGSLAGVVALEERAGGNRRRDPRRGAAPLGTYVLGRTSLTRPPFVYSAVAMTEPTTSSGKGTSTVAASPLPISERVCK
jgi:hypothetical protein